MQKVLGTLKNVILVFVSVFMMGEHVTMKQWIGYQLSLMGFIWYQYLKLSSPTRASVGDQAKKIR